MAATDELHGARTSTNLSESDLELMRKQFSASPKNRVAQNAVSQTSIDEVALDREVVVGTDTTVSNLLDDWSVTNQKNSGRCWLFAGLNLLRVGAAPLRGECAIESTEMASALAG